MKIEINDEERSLLFSSLYCLYRDSDKHWSLATSEIARENLAAQRDNAYKLCKKLGFDFKIGY